MKHDDETALIAATFDALNEGTLARAERQLNRYLGERHGDASGVQDEMWEAWWQGERNDARRALQHLAKHKRMHPHDADTYTFLVRHGVTATPKLTQRVRGRVLVEFVPQFNDPATLVAYALLRLSCLHERIVVCEGCGRMLLDTPHVGHPKRFCSSTCRHRINQQRSRERRAPVKRKRGEGR